MKKVEEDKTVALPFSFEDDVGSNNSGYYTLHAVLTHQGRSSSSGHYVGWVCTLHYILITIQLTFDFFAIFPLGTSITYWRQMVQVWRRFCISDNFWRDSPFERWRWLALCLCSSVWTAYFEGSSRWKNAGIDFVAMFVADLTVLKFPFVRLKVELIWIKSIICEIHLRLTFLSMFKTFFFHTIHSSLYEILLNTFLISYI